MQTIYTLTASLFVFAALFSVVRAVQAYMRHENIKAAGAHRMKLAGLIGKIEGDPDSSKKLRKVVDRIATYCFSDEWLNEFIGSVYNTKKANEDCGPNDVVRALMGAEKQFEIHSLNALYTFLQIVNELRIVALLTHGKLTVGTHMRLHPETLKRMDEELELVREILFTGKQENQCKNGRKQRTRKILVQPTHVTLDEGMIRFLDNTRYATAGI